MTNIGQKLRPVFCNRRIGPRRRAERPLRVHPAIDVPDAWSSTLHRQTAISSLDFANTRDPLSSPKRAAVGRERVTCRGSHCMRSHVEVAEWRQKKKKKRPTVGRCRRVAKNFFFFFGGNCWGDCTLEFRCQVQLQRLLQRPNKPARIRPHSTVSKSGCLWFFFRFHPSSLPSFANAPSPLHQHPEATMTFSIDSCATLRHPEPQQRQGLGRNSVGAGQSR